MTPENPADDVSERARQRRVRVGWILTALGGLVMLWGVLYMTTHAIGGRVEDFAHRRRYDETKMAAHQAYPGFLWRAALGAALVWAGARVRGGGRDTKS